ncbi:MAG: Gldg family protein [Akkermansiaceae bacterium]|nr:Gldg family protein [Akkermansiaceae bacterium]
MAKAKITYPTFRAILGIVAVILIVIFSNWLVSSTSVGNRNIDLTEDKRHTLTEGTKAILSELDSPVIIRYYATRKSEAMPRRIKTYMRKVDDLLKRYANLSGGKVRIEHLDPQPDTDAEDSANLDGISGQRVNDENLYFGLCISCLDQQATIPFLDPSDETMLEYHLSSSIANVSAFEKTKVGLMTTLPLQGAPAQMPGQQPQQPWIIYQLLQQRYDLQDLGMSPAALDPKDIPVLLLIHPAGIDTRTEFLIDQYLLKGGIVIACLDSFALTAPQGDPRMQGMGGVQPSSNLTSLLGTWGIGMDSTSVVADGKYATDFGNNQRMYAHLSLSTDALASEDEIITRGFENLYFPLAGGFTINSGGGVSIETLVKSSKEVVLIPGRSATRPDPGLFARSAPTGKHYGLVMRLKGKFNSAFPEGDPSKAKEDPAEKDPKTKDQQSGEETAKSLTKAEAEGIVYLISDADFLYDRACFRQSAQGYVAVNNNAALLQNILDQCTGSKHLIGSRSRAATMRPFTAVKEMETDFEQEMREDIEKARKSMEDIVTQLQQLQSQKSQGKALVLTPEQEEKIRELQAQQVKLRRELRDKQKGLQAKKDQLYSKIRWMTVGITPAFVALSGLFVWLVRRRTTRVA